MINLDTLRVGDTFYLKDVKLVSPTSFSRLVDNFQLICDEMGAPFDAQPVTELKKYESKSWLLCSKTRSVFLGNYRFQLTQTGMVQSEEGVRTYLKYQEVVTADSSLIYTSKNIQSQAEYDREFLENLIDD